jgi:hypothetical protein
MLTASTSSRASRSRLARSLGGVSLVLFAALLVGVSGCKPKGPTNFVTGKVTLNGEPVSGLISFIDASNKETLGVPINAADGTYTIENPPLGQVKIVVKAMPGASNAPMVKPKDAPMPEMGAPTAMKGVSPPAKYGTATTTPLSYEVKPGKQTYDIPLTP